MSEQERLPQRFKVWIACRWQYGICWPMLDEGWSMQCLTRHAMFYHFPELVINELFGDAEFEWIDNDFGWKGTK